MAGFALWTAIFGMPIASFEGRTIGFEGRIVNFAKNRQFYKEQVILIQNTNFNGPKLKIKTQTKYKDVLESV